MQIANSLFFFLSWEIEVLNKLNLSHFKQVKNFNYLTRKEERQNKFLNGYIFK